MAMLLALTLTGLLSLMGMWLLLQSKTAFRVTTATTRYESVFNMAEAGLQLALYCIKEKTPFPSYVHLSSTVPSAITQTNSQYMQQTNVGNGLAVPEIYYTGYDKNPPQGWSLNWQGYSAFHKVHYMARGEGRLPLPPKEGDSKTAVVSFATKITQ